MDQKALRPTHVTPFPGTPPSPMKKKTETAGGAEPTAPITPLPRKLGADHSETAAHPRKHHKNFKQSVDLREDRGVRQQKSAPKNRD